MMEMPRCLCAHYYNEGHPPDCPVRQRIEQLEATIERVKAAVEDLEQLRVKRVSTSPTTHGIFKDYHGKYIHFNTVMEKLQQALQQEQE